jgi:hypothetical protein
MQWKPVLTFALAVLPAVYGGTRMVQSWAAPGASEYRLKKVLAVAVMKDPGSRRLAEDQMVRSIKKARAEPSYGVLSEADVKDTKGTKEKLLAEGFDGAVVLRPLSMKDRVTYVPGMYPPYYSSFWGFYGWSFSAMYSPGYTVTDQVVQIETHVYSLTDDKLLWSGVSETTNPEQVTKMIAEIAKAAGKRMRKERLID